MSPTGRNPTFPRIQNIPLRTELAKKIQKAFQEEIPKQILEINYSSLEIRVLAELTPSSQARTGRRGTGSPRG